MSQYRDDRAAARHRIQALEASVAERDAELAQREAALAQRDEHIGRLERELERAGGTAPRRPGSTGAARASRFVGAATSLAIVGAGMSLAAVRSKPTVTVAPTPMFLPPPVAPMHADPFVGSVDWAAQPTDAPGAATAPTEPPSAPARAGDAHDPKARSIDFKVWDQGGAPAEDGMRRTLEAKAWSGRATADDLRILKALCSHAGDRECRTRAQAALDALVARGQQGPQGK
jgi:hypothetical protein